MFSLFELDNIPEEQLLKVHPDSKGENEYETRANIALILKDEGNLKDCPLFDKNKEKIDNFLKLLSMDLSELKTKLKKIKISDEFMRKHRILNIYIIQDNMIKFGPRSSDRCVTIRVPTIFEEEHYYDNSYYEAIKSLSDNDLQKFENALDKVDKPHIHYNISKEFSRRIYNNIKTDYDEIFILPSQNIMIHLAVLALQREDSEMFTILNKRMRPKIMTRVNKSIESKYYSGIYHFYPIVEALKYLEINFYYIRRLVHMAISSVSGTSPYEHITYEQFIETIEYLLNKSEMTCENFFKIYLNELRNDRSKRFLLAAMLRLCGNRTNIGKLASKYINLSYIPTEKYT